MEIALLLLVCDFGQSIILVWFRIPGLQHKAVGTIRKTLPNQEPNPSQGVNQMVTPATPTCSRHCAENMATPNNHWQELETKSLSPA